MNQQLAVHLRIFRGKTLTYDKQGNCTTENHPVQLIYDTAEWKNYLKHLRANGVIEATVEKVLNLNEVNDGKVKSDKDYYKEIADFGFVTEEVNTAMNPNGIVALTPEQQQIKDLTARLLALEVKDPVAVNKSEIDPELAQARKEYVEAFGKKGMPTWNAAELRKRVTEHKNQ